MNIFQTILVVINFSTYDAFHSLNDLENFYKTAPAFDPFGATGDLKILDDHGYSDSPF